MIKELCNGSSANAWQETINAPLISLFNIDPSNLKAITNTVYLQQLKYATLLNKNKRLKKRKQAVKACFLLTYFNFYDPLNNHTQNVHTQMALQFVLAVFV